MLRSVDQLVDIFGSILEKRHFTCKGGGSSGNFRNIKVERDRERERKREREREKERNK